MKSLKVEAPKGYEIDKEKSTFENIVFKKIEEGIKPGFWYKNDRQFFYITEMKDGCAYGFGWTDNKYEKFRDTTSVYCMSNKYFIKQSILAEDDEAREFLINKAKEMGYNIGTKIDSNINITYTIKNYVFPFLNSTDESRFYLAGDERGNGCMIFNGIWTAIKEEEEKVVEEEVDFNIHNDTDWFYIETKSGFKFLHKGFLTRKSPSNITYDIDENKFYTGYKLTRSLDSITKLKKVTFEEIIDIYLKNI